MAKRKTVVAKDLAHLKTIIAANLRAQGMSADLNHIDVSSIKQFTDLFKNTLFNGNISQWDTSNAETFEGMFFNSPFNGDITNWNAAKVFNMRSMFALSPFNGDVSRWDVSEATIMSDMFLHSPFDGNIVAWHPTKLVNADGMFRGSPFSGDLSQWRLPDLKDACHMFENSRFNSDVSQWNSPNLSQVIGMFNTPSFQQDLDTWVLPYGARVQSMVHVSYNGILPRVQGATAHESYGQMLGYFEAIAPYAKRNAFSRVHADLLMTDAQDCGWASPEMVRWAQEQMTLGRALGLDYEALNASMVFAQRAKTDAQIDAANLFEVAP